MHDHLAAHGLSLGDELGLAQIERSSGSFTKIISFGIEYSTVFNLVGITLIKRAQEDDTSRNEKAQASDAGRRLGLFTNVVVGSPNATFRGTAQLVVWCEKQYDGENVRCPFFSDDKTDPNKHSLPLRSGETSTSRWNRRSRVNRWLADLGGHGDTCFLSKDICTDELTRG
jgi:hypothetical protein